MHKFSVTEIMTHFCYRAIVNHVIVEMWGGVGNLWMIKKIILVYIILSSDRFLNIYSCITEKKQT